MPRKLLLGFRRDTAANWTAANPVLAAGEPAWESDTNRLKIGNGATAWNALAYFGGTSGVSSLDGIAGAVSLVAGANVTVTDNSPSAGSITIAATGGAGAGITVKRYLNKPAAAITRTNVAVGAFSTPWRITNVVVAAGQNVRLSVDAQLVTNGKDYLLAVLRGVTQVAAKVWSGSVAVAIDAHLEWVDENPGAGTYTYEVQAAAFTSGTLTVQQGNGTADAGTSGGSIFIADVYNP